MLESGPRTVALIHPREAVDREAQWSSGRGGLTVVVWLQEADSDDDEEVRRELNKFFVDIFRAL
jgi:hypothetical protein